MPICEAAICVVAQEHVEKEPKEQVYRGPLVIETLIPLQLPPSLRMTLLLRTTKLNLQSREMIG